MKIENYKLHKDYKWKLKTTNYTRIINENCSLYVLHNRGILILNK